MSNIFLALGKSPSEDFRFRTGVCDEDFGPLRGVGIADKLVVAGLALFSKEQFI